VPGRPPESGQPPGSGESRLAEEEGPLASPVLTAAIIAVLGVFVMTVSVGALAALRRFR
jgi:hypothetical protein